MTIVAIWYEKTDGFLWCVADTRISSPSGHGGQIIRTDSASKVFQLPVLCGTPDGRRPYHSTTHGFAFAGDVLPAVSTYSAAAVMLQKLISYGPNGKDPGGGVPAFIKDIASFCGRLGESYMKESMSSSNGKYGHFEFAVFGYDHWNGRFEIAHVSPCPDNPTAMKVKLVLPEDKGDIVILGKQDEFHSAQDELLSKKNTPDDTARVPMRVMERIVSKGTESGTVGGSLSIAIAQKEGLSQFGSASNNPFFDRGIISYNGISLDGGNEQVGHLDICIPSIIKQTR